MKRTIIIAEAGVNHNGSLENAKKLVDIAKIAGADFVKFQTFKTELNISRKAKKAKYQVENTEDVESQYDMVKKLEFSFEDFAYLKQYCDKSGIGFLSTAFDLPSIKALEELQDIFKVPSGEITNYPYLKTIAGLGKKVILSTGMADMSEIQSAFQILTSEKLTRNDICILHCNTEYPTPIEDVNLKAMLAIGEKFGVAIGYSDHTLGIDVPIAAVALGATVIEKHFTLDRNLPGPDHRASLEPIELGDMVKSIRNIELAMSGDGIKKPSASELKNKIAARKSIHTRRRVAKDTILTEEDLIPLRPGDGISPMEWKDVIGKKVNRDFSPFEILTREAIL